MTEWGGARETGGKSVDLGYEMRRLQVKKQGFEPSWRQKNRRGEQSYVYRVKLSTYLLKTVRKITGEIRLKGFSVSRCLTPRCLSTPTPSRCLAGSGSSRTSGGGIMRIQLNWGVVTSTSLLSGTRLPWQFSKRILPGAYYVTRLGKILERLILLEFKK